MRIVGTFIGVYVCCVLFGEAVVDISARRSRTQSVIYYTTDTRRPHMRLKNTYSLTTLEYSFYVILWLSHKCYQYVIDMANKSEQKKQLTERKKPDTG